MIFSAFYGGSKERQAFASAGRIYSAATSQSDHLIPLPPLLDDASLSPDPFYSPPLSDASQASAPFNEKPYPLVYEEQFLAAPQDGAFDLEGLDFVVTDPSFLELLDSPAVNVPEYFNQFQQNAPSPPSSSTGASEVSDPLSVELSDDEFLDILRSVSGDMSLSLERPVTLDSSHLADFSHFNEMESSSLLLTAFANNTPIEGIIQHNLLGTLSTSTTAAGVTVEPVASASAPRAKLAPALVTAPNASRFRGSAVAARQTPERLRTVSHASSSSAVSEASDPTWLPDEVAYAYGAAPERPRRLALKRFPTEQLVELEEDGEKPPEAKRAKPSKSKTQLASKKERKRQKNREAAQRYSPHS
jgi:hypothetical protein